MYESWQDVICATIAKVPCVLDDGLLFAYVLDEYCP
jgi:hypothetical protein